MAASSLHQLAFLTSHGNAYIHRMLTENDFQAIQESNNIRNQFAVKPFNQQHELLAGEFAQCFQSSEYDSQKPADAIIAWFRDLSKLKVQRLWLTGNGPTGALPPQIAMAFVNAVPKGIAAVTDKETLFFVPHWKYNQDKWNVTYDYHYIPVKCHFGDGNINECLDFLKETLKGAIEFCEKGVALKEWAPKFAGYLDQLHSDNPKYIFSDIPSKGYSLDARRLYSASVVCQIFGGMGSWNDVWFIEPELQESYDLYSSKIYKAITDGFDTAVNAFDPTIV
jgi:hypothetical protein